MNKTIYSKQNFIDVPSRISIPNPTRFNGLQEGDLLKNDEPIKFVMNDNGLVFGEVTVERKAFPNFVVRFTHRLPITSFLEGDGHVNQLMRVCEGDARDIWNEMLVGKVIRVSSIYKEERIGNDERPYTKTIYNFDYA